MEPAKSTKKRKRGRRSPKLLYERGGSMFFGHGFTISYNDLRDVAAALYDNGRQISSQVKQALPTDLFNALEQPSTPDQQLMICSLLARMHEQNQNGLITVVEGLSHLRIPNQQNADSK